MGCYSSTVIKAPADQVWEAVKNFHDLSWSKNVINSVDVVGNKRANEIGAKRVLNGVFHETLRSLDNNAKRFTFSIDDGPAAVSKDNVEGYLSEVRVFTVSDNNTSFVVWTSQWESTKEDGIAEFCNPIYHALLQDLKEHFHNR